MSFRNEDLRRYEAMERKTMQRWRALVGPQDPEFVHPPAGGQATTVQSLRITGFGAGNRTLICQEIDGNGDPTGDDIEVYVYSVPLGHAPGGDVGVVDLVESSTYPTYEVGHNVRVETRREHMGPTAGWVEGLFAQGHAMEYGCVAEVGG